MGPALWPDMRNISLTSLLALGILLGTVTQASAQADALTSPSEPPVEAPAVEARPAEALPAEAPPVQAPPVEARPVQATPAPVGAAPPIQGASVQAARGIPHTVEVHVEANHEALVLHHVSGGTLRPGERLALAPGAHQFAVSVNDSNPIETDPVVIDRPGLLRAEYVRRSGTRTTGWILFGISTPLAILGAVGGSLGFASGNLGAVLLGFGSFIAGGINLILALAVGLPLAAVGDGARIRFE